MNLLELTQTGLTGDNKDYFKLDEELLLYKNQGLSPMAISVLLNITIAKVAGRVTSFVRRGHLTKTSNYTYQPKVKSEPKVTKIPTPLGNNIELRDKIVFELENGSKYNDIIELLNTKRSVISAVKRFMMATSLGEPSVSVLKKFIDTNPSVKISKNTYTNSEGLNKELARLKMAKYILDSKSVGLVLTLPHIKWSIEKKILNENPNYTFLGVETHADTFTEMRATVRNENLPSKCYKGLLSDKMYGKHQDTYTHIIADYCGGIAKHSKEIEYALRNNIIKRGGIFAITIGKAIRGKGKNSDFIMSLGATKNNYSSDSRCDSDRAIEAYFNRNIGNDYEFLEIFNYTDIKEGGKGYPMSLIILKRK